MFVETRSWNINDGWQKRSENSVSEKDAQLVIYFGARGALDSEERYNELRSFYPNAHIIGCSTGGEIIGDEAKNDSVVASAIQFENTTLEVTEVSVTDDMSSHKAGCLLAENLHQDNLKYVFVLSDGVHINGTKLVKGIMHILPEDVVVTGGLAADGSDFHRTLVGLNGKPVENKVVAVGLYGDHISVTHDNRGGWGIFGAERVISRAEGTVLYELDGKPALDLYKKYLGDEAKNLPTSALLFPLSTWPKNKPDEEVLRTIVGVDESNKSMIFSGDITEGHIASLMCSSSDELVNAASQAASNVKTTKGEGDALAIMVSCIGRKSLLGEMTAEEVESAASAFEHQPFMIGFYSYGQICPHTQTHQCELHNQTMAITLITEK